MSNFKHLNDYKTREQYSSVVPIAVIENIHCWNHYHYLLFNHDKNLKRKVSEHKRRINNEFEQWQHKSEYKYNTETKFVSDNLGLRFRFFSGHKRLLVHRIWSRPRAMTSIGFRAVKKKKKSKTIKRSRSAITFGVLCTHDNDIVTRFNHTAHVRVRFVYCNSRLLIRTADDRTG